MRDTKLQKDRLLTTLVVLSAAAGLLAASCGASRAGTLISKPQEFYNDGCDGLLFDARVSGSVSILGIKKIEPEGEAVASFVFETDGTLQEGSPIVNDAAPPAKSFMKGDDKVCFQFGQEDTSDHACMKSLISTGAFCLDVAEE